MKSYAKMMGLPPAISKGKRQINNETSENQRRPAQKNK
jgi:hypothetical protein